LAAGGRPVTVRLLDFSGDKVPPFLRRRTERGVAGPPVLPADPGALSAQVRAIVALGAAGDPRIMAPMVRTAADVAAVRRAVGRAAADTGRAPPPVGAMVETVPAAAAVAEVADAADFLSLGTNDLTGEILGLARTNPRARPELAAHPRVLAAVARTVAAADRAGVPVSVCGDAAAHPATVPLLVGAGLRTFSVPAAGVDETRYRLRRLDATACRDLVRDALALDEVEDVLALVAERMGEERRWSASS
jgi:phosphoenolpyruvate-protein kinase (PTS system EI component)